MSLSSQTELDQHTQPEVPAAVPRLLICSPSSNAFHRIHPSLLPPPPRAIHLVSTPGSMSSSVPCSLYAILRVQPGASPEDIRKAFKKRALETYTYMPSPPPTSSREQEKQRKQRLKEIQAAFDVLGDPARRRAYDDELNGSASPSRASSPSPTISPPSPPPLSADAHSPDSAPAAAQADQGQGQDQIQEQDPELAQRRREREEWVRRRAEKREERMRHAQREAIRARLGSSGPLVELADNMDDVWRKISGREPDR